MKTRAPLCLLITGLFASATLQGCYMTRTVAVGNHKEVVQINAVPPNAKIWKDDPSNIVGPSPQQVEFEYTEEKEELTWGYYLNLALSAGIGLAGVVAQTSDEEEYQLIALG